MDSLIESLMEAKESRFSLLKKLSTLQDVLKEIKAMGWNSFEEFSKDVEFAEPILDKAVQTEDNTRRVEGVPIDDLVGVYVEDAEQWEEKQFLKNDLAVMEPLTVPVFQLIDNVVYIEKFPVYKDKEGKVWVSVSLMN